MLSYDVASNVCQALSHGFQGVHGTVSGGETEGHVHLRGQAGDVWVSGVPRTRQAGAIGRGMALLKYFSRLSSSILEPLMWSTQVMSSANSSPVN